MRLPFHVWLAGAVIACLSLAVSFDDYWAMFIARVWCIAVAALGAHVLLARVGMLSFGQALFFGVGAYAGAFLVKAMDSGNLLLLLPAGFIAGGAAAYLVALLVFGQRAVPAATLALSTMTLGYVAERLVRGWEWTGGQNGLPGIPQMSLLGHELQQPWQMLAVAAVVLGLVLVAVTLLESSSWGSRLSALGHDEMRLRFFGVNVARDKQLIFAIAGGLAGLAGSLLAGVEGFVGPSSIGPVFSTTLVLYVLLAGPSTAPFAILSVLVVELMSFWLSQWYEQLWTVILAVLMLVIITLRHARYVNSWATFFPWRAKKP